MMLDNKLKQGKANFMLPELPPFFYAFPGVKPINLIIENGVGPEIALLITEPGAMLRKFSKIEITDFMLKVGLVNTSYGPLCWFLFYFPDPETGSSVIYEITLNPHDQQQLMVYESLANQKYWHVIIADDHGDVINLFEFPNKYGLANTLQQVKTVCADKPISDFSAAKSEYESKYSIDDLFRM